MIVNWGLLVSWNGCLCGNLCIRGKRNYEDDSLNVSKEWINYSVVSQGQSFPLRMEVTLLEIISDIFLWDWSWHVWNQWASDFIYTYTLSISSLN